ncbi:MAG: topoisomerase C-terminal repeat-containing protein, partial [Planctomycetia bacterium]
GPYIKHGVVNATVPKDTEISNVTLEQAVLWLSEKAAKGGSRKTARKSATAKKSGERSTTKSVVKKVRKKSAKKSS